MIRLPYRWGAAVFLQIIDPQAFGGLEYIKQEAGWLATACREAEAMPGGPGVRLPGQAGLAHRRDALENGIELATTIMPLLEPWAKKLGVPLPPTV